MISDCHPFLIQIHTRHLVLLLKANAKGQLQYPYPDACEINTSNSLVSVGSDGLASLIVMVR